jgi:hypothetical protein
MSTEAQSTDETPKSEASGSEDLFAQLKTKDEEIKEMTVCINIGSL